MNRGPLTPTRPEPARDRRGDRLGIDAAADAARTESDAGGVAAAARATAAVVDSIFIMGVPDLARRGGRLPVGPEIEGATTLLTLGPGGVTEITRYEIGPSVGAHSGAGTVGAVVGPRRVLVTGPHELVLVRHGETEWSRSGRHTGRTDIALTDRGRAQADQLALALRGRRFALVLSSSLTRAWDTCERAGLARVAEPCPDLQEWDYGDHEGRSTAAIRTQIPDWSVWTHPITGGETVEQVGERADRVIEQALGIDGDVALFAHGHLLRILAVRWLGLPPTGGRLFGLDTATVSTLGFERTNRVIRHWNEGGHLREPSAPEGA